MASGAGEPDLSIGDYEAIEAAVMETARGRWFLAEFARRQRAAETQMLIEAIGKLEKAVAALQPQTPATVQRPLNQASAAAPSEPRPLPPRLNASPSGTGPPAAEKSRIVIIRRPASDAVDIPLVAEAS